MGTRPVATLRSALDAPRREVNGRAGRVACYVAGDGPPFLLIHSINAAASAFEVAPLFAHLRQRYRVYAPDLPGFGFADRSPRRYDIALYVDALRDLLDAIDADCPGKAVDAAALSLSGEFLARVALERSAQLRTLVLVNPTGFSRRYRAPPAGSGSREMAWVSAILEFPLWRQALYDALVSRASIRYFLQRTYGSRDVDAGLVDYAWMTAHQPGARHAPLSFLSGRLFSADIQHVYRQLVLPVWMPHGTRGDFRDFSAADWTRATTNWLAQPFDTGALVHFERPLEFNAALDRFLGSGPAR